MPVLGLGAWQLRDGHECTRAVEWALGCGYRMIDTAQEYGNEESVGRAVRSSGIARDQVFVTTKFDPTLDDPLLELQASLNRLGMDYVDLYLVHWPEKGTTWAWPAMERAYERGYARAIGVSNFSTSELDELFAVADLAPALNQLQLNPFAYRRGLLDACRARDVAVGAYSSLGTGEHLGDPVIAAIAAQTDRTRAQVLLRWALQHDLIVIPKSGRRDRIEANAAIFDFALSSEAMAALDALDRTNRTDEARRDKWW